MIKNKKMVGIIGLSVTISASAIAYANSVLQKDVSLITNGKKVEMKTYTNDVQEFLAEQSVKYDSDDIITLELDKKLVDGDVIEVTSVEQELVTEAKETKFTTNIVEDDSLLKGKTVVDTEGKAGENELVYKLTYHNGKQVSKVLVEENIKTEPINEVIKKGTKVEVAQVSTSRGESSRDQETSSNNTDKKPSKKPSSNNTVASSTMSVVSTAYSINGTTATGTQTRWGVIAVDPSVIPYGTKVYIPEFGMTFIAEDCGGAIKGNKIDIYMPSIADAKQWGRRTISIQIVK